MIHLFAIIPLLLAAVQPAAAEPAVCALIRQNYSKKGTISATFDQSIYWSVREKTSTTRGTLLLAPGNRFRVELPNETYISDGSVYWQYRRGDNQLVIRNFADLDPATHPSRLLTTFLSDHPFTETARSGGTVTLAWSSSDTSGADENAYRSIVIEAQAATGIVKSLVATDVNKNIHTYRFSKTVFGKAAPANTFTFEAPPNATVIDHRK